MASKYEKVKDIRMIFDVIKNIILPSNVLVYILNRPKYFPNKDAQGSEKLIISKDTTAIF